MPIIATGANPLPQITPSSPIAAVPVTNVEVPNSQTPAAPAVLRPVLYDVRVSQDALLDFIFRDERGNPCDFSEMAPNRFKAIARECVQGALLPNIPVSLSNAAEGGLQLHITPEITKVPGVYNCSLICTPSGRPDAILKENPFYLYITHSVSFGSLSGPPALWELRLQLRDTSPSENLLFDGLNFADEEIAFSVKKAIMAFNETPPIEDYPKFNSSNFPFPDLLKDGVIGQLYITLAEYQRKNNLQYSAGGVSLNDKNKESNYLQMGQTYWQSFLQQSQLKKVNFNMENNWDTVSSAYASESIWF